MNVGLSRMILVVAAAAGGVQCGGGGMTGPGVRPCDPFQTDTKPITLGPVLGVGRDAGGVIYVVDGQDGEPARLFIATDAKLMRQPVRGSGTVSDPEGTLAIINSGSVDAPITLEVRLVHQRATAMGIYRGKLDTKTFALGAMGETLELLALADIAGLPVENLPGTISALQVARTDDGRQLLVTYPDVDGAPENTRLFFGPSTAVRERPIHPTARPGSYLRLEFDLDGQLAVVTFASPLNTGITSMIAVGGQSLPLTDAPKDTRPAGTTYLCL